MWESCLSGSERGRSSTVIWTGYCGTAAKAGGNRENKHCPVVTEVSCLLENNELAPLGHFIEIDSIPYSKFDVGRWMFDVHRFIPFEGPS